MSSENKNNLDTREEIISLIEKARDGSVEALQSLKSKYYPLIDSQVNKYFADYMSNQDRDDMYEEATSAFFGAVCTYNCGEEHVEFGLYAKICISNRLLTFVRAYNSKKIHGVSSLEDVEGFVPSDTDDPLELVVQKESIGMLVKIISESLSPYEAKIWWLYTSGMSAKEIAQRVNGGDVKSVNNAIYRIRTKLRKILGASNR